MACSRDVQDLAECFSVAVGDRNSMTTVLAAGSLSVITIIKSLFYNIKAF